MTDPDIYDGLKRFMADPIWTDYLRPRLQEWAKSKAAAMDSAKTPNELWDARVAAKTAAEAMPLLDEALDGIKRKLARSLEAPTSAQ